MPALTAAWRAGIWPAPGLQHLAHDHVLDLVAADPGPLQGGLDREAAEVGAGEGLERAQQPAHGRTRARDDHRGRAVGRDPVMSCDPLTGCTGRGVNEGLLRMY